MLLTLEQEVLTHYMDRQYMITVDRDPTGNWSHGNSWLEWASFIGLLTHYKQPISGDTVKSLLDASRSCRALNGGLNKNPGRLDEITRDDIYGYLVARHLLRFSVDSFVGVLSNNEWIATNTGQFYWNAFVWPWDRAFYKLLTSTMKPTKLEAFLLKAKIVLAGFFGKSASSTRLDLIMCQALKDKPEYKDLCEFWETRFYYRWGSLKRLYSRVHERPHPFSRCLP